MGKTYYNKIHNNPVITQNEGGMKKLAPAFYKIQIILPSNKAIKELLVQAS